MQKAAEIQDEYGGMSRVVDADNLFFFDDARLYFNQSMWAFISCPASITMNFRTLQNSILSIRLYYFDYHYHPKNTSPLLCVENAQRRAELEKDIRDGLYYSIKSFYDVYGYSFDFSRYNMVVRYVSSPHE